MPVNEYKIADKIVAANRELFGEKASNNGNSTAVDQPPIIQSKPIPVHIDKDVATSSTKSRQRVTFSVELEDYEPDCVIDSYDDDDDDNITGDDDEDVDEDERDDVDSNTNDEDYSQNECDSDCIEEDCAPENKSSILSVADKVNMMLDSPNRQRKIQNVSLASGDVDSGNVEQICKVIRRFELEESNPGEALPPSATSEITASPNAGKFPEHDNVLERNSNEKGNLSSAIDRQEYLSDHLQPKSNVKRDTLSSKCTTNHNHRHKTQPPPSSVQKIPINFKACCELKNADAQRLPRYCGYISQYGLSREQLDQRQARLQRRHERRDRRLQDRAEDEQFKIRVNEEAFARWLTVKMRRAKTSKGSGVSGGGSRNMYDCGRTRKRF